MQSLLVVSKDKKKQEEYLNQLFLELGIAGFDIHTVESEKSIGIEEVRIFQKKIFLKPIKSPIKAVLINCAETLTLEAQNALLKVLEEPPTHTIIILNASNENTLLPTILSRCKIVKLNIESKILEEKEREETSNLLEILFSEKTGSKLKLAQEISKTKEECLLILEKIILTLREKLMDSPTVQLLHCSIVLNKTYTIIKTTNVNSRLALENLFLNIESTIPVCQFDSKPGLES